ncbi:sugar transporter SWEET1 [Amyelois transitella]|uniref:sugar transporter SWEET1 n=1 Tax=Amyelois transitella TaxID=680683 RepID=UPI00067CAAC2|nr:sugar transporter SWEET1 [Amyelois transitella]
MKPVPGMPDIYAGIRCVSILAVITTVLQFLSGTLVCKQYVKNQTTGESSPLPFLCGMLSCGLWLLYGLTINDDTITLVNTIGIILMTSYTIIFYIYTLNKSSLIKQIGLIGGILILMTHYVSSEINTDKLIQRLGLLACSLTLLTIVSPMNKLFYVMKVKSTECLPFPMILMSFFVSLLWCIYGLLIVDPYLTLPNAIGAVLAILQLSLFLFYPRVPSSPSIKSIIA